MLQTVSRLDPHSYADSDQPQASHLAWQARVDFNSRAIEARATLSFQGPVSGPVDLDTRDLELSRVENDRGELVGFELLPPEPILGQRLRLELPDSTRQVHLWYRTSPAATALQWLEPAQTASGQSPYLYTHAQPIHARSIIPLQDTPRNRLTYEAELTLPTGLKAVMAAEALGSDSQDGQTLFRFRMPQPISPYLFAFAIGDLAAREIGPRSRVWAEPSVVDAAAWEFEGTDAMLQAGEALFGPYDWDRYDVLVLPPSFPYGGMENPRLTFLTPTVIAGDRSLVAVIAHELAHSWTGNLISNANAEHFWLNEGFTTYAERRIVEAVFGQDAVLLDWALGRRSLEEAIRQQEAEGHPELTRLRTQLEGVDPDAAYSTIPYEKGALFLRLLEDAAGRDRFDRFLRAYIAAFRFQAITTEQFTDFVEQQLAGLLAQVDADAWLYGPGLPANAPRLHSNHLESIQALAMDAQPPSDSTAASWNALEWQLYLESLPPSTSLALVEELDRRFALGERTNYELLVAWLVVAVRAGYRPAYSRAADVLRAVGRNKFLRPLYRALVAAPEGRPLAEETFAAMRDRYHHLSVNAIQPILAMPSV